MAHFLKTGVLRLVSTSIQNTNQIRNYARWSHRRPRRVIPPEGFDRIEANHQKNSQVTGEHIGNEEKIIELNAETDLLQKPREVTTNRRKFPNVKAHTGLIGMNQLDDSSNKITRSKNEPKKKKTSYKLMDTNSKATSDMLETVIDANGDLIYTKLKDNDPVIGQLLLTVKSHKQQVKKDLALLEGRRLIKEALQAQCVLKNLIFSRKSDIEYLKPYLPKSGAKIYKMPYREIQMWSDLTTTPGIMGIFKTPDVECFVPKDSLPLTVVCDNVREPGNLGAILRSAAGVGARSVILTKGCVDLWDTKVLRSACGSHFCLQIHKKMNWSDIRKQINNAGSTVFIADNKIITENIVSPMQADVERETVDHKTLSEIVVSTPLVPYYGVSFSDFGSLVLIVGGETEGISEESYRLAADFKGIRLNIPLRNSVESLNTGTALGIILFEIKRQLLVLSQKNKIEVLQ